MKVKQKGYFLVGIIFSLLNISLPDISATKPRVFIFTDINIDLGDPDDRQSLIHLLWYSDVLEIEGIVPDEWNDHGFEACELAIEAYKNDYNDYSLNKKGYPSPQKFNSMVARDLSEAKKLFHAAASKKESPLYVLIWGNMETFGEALNTHPEVSRNIRIISIGTNRFLDWRRPEFYPSSRKETGNIPCEYINWNGHGRNQIFNDSKFDHIWWLEIDWTYIGMFTGDSPSNMMFKLEKFGSMGRHIKEVVNNQPNYYYFKVGDTPSVLYLIDPENDLDDPIHGSWAGKFVKPFPLERPNYYTDYNGDVNWDYENPCNTWDNRFDMLDNAKRTLEIKRPHMYQSLIKKLNRIYQLE
jgi:hypothetical protein